MITKAFNDATVYHIHSACHTVGQTWITYMLLI